MAVPPFGASGVASVTKQLASRSALNPSLLLAAIAGVVGYPLSYFAPSPMNYFAFTISSLPTLIACWQIIRFTMNDPDRLQNDTHVENKMMISLMGENSPEGGKQIIIDQNLPLVQNPRLSNGDED